MLNILLKNISVFGIKIQQKYSAHHIGSGHNSYGRLIVYVILLNQRQYTPSLNYLISI